MRCGTDDLLYPCVWEMHKKAALGGVGAACCTCRKYTHTQTLPKCSYHSQTHVHIFKALKDRKTPFSHINQIKTNGFVLFSGGELGRLFASRLYEPEMYIVREALC